MTLLVIVVQSLAIIGMFVLYMLCLRDLQRIQRRSKMITEEPYEEPEAICGCTHHQCFHDETGCGHNSRIYEGYSTQPKILSCGCKKYMGPEHLPKVLP
jgi:hypothetical protein